MEILLLLLLALKDSKLTRRCSSLRSSSRLASLAVPLLSVISNLTSLATEYTAPLGSYASSDTSEVCREIIQDAVDIISAKSEILTDPSQPEQMTIFLPPPGPYNIFLFPSPLGIYIIPPESLGFCPTGWCLDKVCGKVVEGKK